MAASDRGYSYPARRPLTVLPFDPMIDRSGRFVSVDVPYERLAPGPSGRLIEVIDYDGTRDTFYEPVDLEDAAVLLQGGLDPNEADPRFHQQMVYAVAMGVLEHFERGLGRAFRWRGDLRLRIYPHAFEKRNACFDPDLGRSGALEFGYFRAVRHDPGQNLPGQLVFTCLSHGIVAHETTHAVIHRLRPHFAEPTNPDVLGFHEGLADVVALLMPFTYDDIVHSEIARTRGDLASGGELANGTALLELAAQFGFAGGDGKALRNALDRPDPGALAAATEPHDRGEILAQAVTSGFLRAYRDQANSSIRLATSGTGVLAAGALHPDLVDALTRSARKSAERLLNMCIRAVDYLPPVDVTFGDYLRAIVTADADLFPSDTRGIRTGFIEAFRERGIYPADVVSLAERSIRIPRADASAFSRPVPSDAQFMLESLQEVERRSPATAADGADAGDRADGADAADAYEKIQNATDLSESATAPTARRYARELHRWATEATNKQLLGLTGPAPVQVAAFQISQRPDDDGYIRPFLTAQFTQTDGTPDPDLGGLQRRGGTTVIADSCGRVRYVISRPYPTPGSETDEQLHQFVADLEHRHPQLAWSEDPHWVVNHLKLRDLDESRSWF